MAQQATLHTNHGDIVLTLFAEQAPNTVESSAGLATGTPSRWGAARGVHS